MIDKEKLDRAKAEHKGTWLRSLSSRGSSPVYSAEDSINIQLASFVLAAKPHIEM